MNFYRYSNIEKIFNAGTDREGIYGSIIAAFLFFSFGIFYFLLFLLILIICFTVKYLATPDIMIDNDMIYLLLPFNKIIKVDRIITIKENRSKSLKNGMTLYMGYLKSVSIYSEGLPLIFKIHGMLISGKYKAIFVIKENINNYKMLINYLNNRIEVS